MDDQILTPTEAAKFLQIHINTLYLLRKQGTIPCHDLPPAKEGKGSTRFLKSELIEWLKKR
ncbi:helix-turn-helix transcriptional regulator [Treponema pectinovorum]|uniref:helix-turn-helix transcriptional regulator n=1 Tax=Treponema pectinovorum TaxID=164 RepID=UPI0011CA3EA8|nr:helix-turn-helix domain-containing protein [Treponema pectinovorum]